MMRVYFVDTIFPISFTSMWSAYPSDYDALALITFDNYFDFYQAIFRLNLSFRNNDRALAFAHSEATYVRLMSFIADIS